MKYIINTLAVCAVVALSLLIIAGSYQTRAQTTDSLATLQGQDAVENLKETGRYESLVDAVKAARRSNGQKAPGFAPDAVGQSTKLIGATGADGDQIGWSVAISGNTAIIGSPGDDVGSNAVQGSAYVFVLNGTVWSQQAQLIASDGTVLDQLGHSVSISGDTAIVGTPFDNTTPVAGSAYVFVRSGTSWTQQAKLKAVDGGSFDNFAISVGISGDTAVIGASEHDVGPNALQGAVYVFVRSDTSWSQQAKLVTEDGSANDFLGAAVAIDGNTIIAGAGLDDVGSNSDQGSAYVFVRTGTIWTQQAKLLASDGASNDNFGLRGVAISGETAVVGAPNDDAGSSNFQGSAYVFVRSGGSWSEQARLTSNDTPTDAQFGRTVGISGNTVVIGASGDEVGPNQFQGSAYVFTRTGTTWQLLPALTASDGAAEDLFGHSVAVSGNNVIVGAYLDDIRISEVVNSIDQGSAYAFRVLGNTWTQEAREVAPSGAAADQFGNSVAISGDTAVVGSLTDDVGPNTNQGSAYVFVRFGNDWVFQAQLLASDGSAFDLFGASVAISGDTIVVGAWGDQVGSNANQGSAYIFFRLGGSWAQQAKLIASDGAAQDMFGFSVGISGDTAVVGAYQDDVGANEDQGSAYVFIRFSGTSWGQQIRLTAADGAASELFGYGVAATDNGNTVIVGAQADNIGLNEVQGSAYVFVRQNSGAIWSQQVKLTASDGADRDQFGWSVSISGDTAIVGAVADDIGANTNQGSAYIFVRSGTTWAEQQKLIAPDGSANDRFGWSVSISGDTAVVGAPLDDVPPNADQGSAYVFDRTGSLWTQRQQLVAMAGAAGDEFGNAAAIYGDKIVVGAPLSDASTPSPIAGKNVSPAAADQGAAYFFVNQPQSPTAASVSIGGRVLNEEGRGVTQASVYLTLQNGETIATRTKRNGSYMFPEVEAGQTVILIVTSRRYDYDPKVIEVTDSVSDMDFVPREP